MKEFQDSRKNKCRSSRGYSGYFTTKTGIKLYLRSSKEFVVASWLSSLETPNRIVLGEWYFDSYRPDFRVMINGKLRFVIEVKDNKKDALVYMQKYKEQFVEMGVHYVVIYKSKHFSKIINKLNLDLEEWKRNSVYDHSGSNNPAFGRKNSKETKEKIGNKTRERCQNEEYMKDFREKIKNNFTEDRRTSISNSTRYHAKLRKEIRDAKDPIVNVSCVFCGKQKDKRLSATKPEEFCSAKCASPYYKQVGRTRVHSPEEVFDRMKLCLLNYAIILSTHYNCVVSSDIIRTAKEEGVIRKNCQLSDNSILKYFNSYETLNEDIKNGKND